jgi:HlyD family secretion protein
MNAAPKVQRLLVSVLVLLLAGCGGWATPGVAPASSDAAAGQTAEAEGGRLAVLGTIRPARTVHLAFVVGGTLHSECVKLGQEVRAGDLLARLEAAELELDLRQAAEALALSQARLAQARAGPRQEAVAVAEAEYRRAQAQHEALLAGVLPDEVAAFRADYQAALVRYRQVKAGALPEDLIVAQAAVDRTGAALQRAQAAYDLVAGRPDVGASPQAAALHEATVDYEAAKAQYQRLKNLPTKADLELARADLAHAEAQLALVQAGPTPGEVAASIEAVAVARAQLALAKAGPRAEDVALAEVQVQQAHTALARAEQSLSKAELLAPFDGVVSGVYLHAGEWAGPGVAVVELLDASRWRVETRNVGELSIGRVRVGQSARVRIMAFRGKDVGGLVLAISPLGVVQQGDTTYTVIIELEPTDLALRPGMNAEVEIVTTEPQASPGEVSPVSVWGNPGLRPWCCSACP